MKRSSQKIQTKPTKKLFLDKYQYKIALVCPIASWFRGANLNFVLTKLMLIDSKQLPLVTPLWNKMKTPADLDYCLHLHHELSKMSDFDLRVEHPILSFYTNNPKDIKTLSNIDSDRVKYISAPETNQPTLTKNVVYLPKVPFDYKLTLGRTRTSYDSFLKWAENNDKVRLTNRCKEDLSSNHSWGGSYFYVKDDRSLTLVKMFLGTEISRIDRVISTPAP